MPLVASHPLVDRVLGLGVEALAELQARTFDLLLCADKDRVGGGLASSLRARERRGFGMDERGAIVPLNPEAGELYALGLDDERKFRLNQKSEPQLLAEAWALGWRREPYVLHLDEGERSHAPRRKVGFNTGCSPLYPL